MIARIIHYFTSGIWQGRLARRGTVRRWGAGTARALLIAARRFAADRCQLWACTLTFYSLLSIVPLVAMAFGIAKGFGLEEALHRLVGSITGWQGDISERIIRFALAFLQQARGGLIAGIGVAVLLWSVVSMLGNIEAALNAIWEIRRPRLLMRKFADYLSMMLVGTVLVIVSGSLTVAVAGQVRGITARMAVLGAAGDVVLLLLQLFPYLIVWALFSFIYIFMPNGPVPLRAGLVAGIVAGTAFQLVQWIYIKFQIGVSSYGPVYGSFAALPLFLVWLQTSWMIVMAGAELSRAVTEIDTFGYDPDYAKLGVALRRLLALRVMQCVVRSFAHGERAPTAADLSAKLEIPGPLVRQILAALHEADLVAENAAAGAPSYQPVRDVACYSVLSTVAAMERRGINDAPPGPEPDPGAGAAFAGALQQFAAALEHSPANRRLIDIGDGSPECRQ